MATVRQYVEGMISGPTFGGGGGGGGATSYLMITHTDKDV